VSEEFATKVSVMSQTDLPNPHILR